MDENFDMLLAGVGGQGIIFAGQIIMEAVLLQGFRVMGFEEHGMARRGGAVASHIRFGKEVHTPLIPVGLGKLLAAFEPAEALRHVHYMDSSSKFLLNTKPVVPNTVSSGEATYPSLNEIIDVIMTRSKETFTIEATALAQRAGNPIAMNVVMLGGISAMEPAYFPKDVVLEVIKKRSPSYSLGVNLKAFEIGYDKIKNFDKI